MRRSSCRTVGVREFARRKELGAEEADESLHVRDIRAVADPCHLVIGGLAIKPQPHAHHDPRADTSAAQQLSVRWRRVANLGVIPRYSIVRKTILDL